MDKASDNALKNRIFIILAYFLFFFTILLARAFYLQIVIGDELRIRQQQFLLQQTLKSGSSDQTNRYEDKDIIQFNAPSLYRKNHDSIIELVIRPASNISESDIFNKLSSKNKTEFLIVAPELVSLYFDIALLSPKAQPLTLGRETKWRWQVIANRSGKSQFHIALNTKNKFKESEYEFTYINIDQEFIIETAWATFYYENWQWFWTMIFTILLFAVGIIAKPYESIISHLILKKILGK